ncbi:MAG: D-tagatose-bisphosphate aldolase, class II, non-catalytic subunit [Gammaproteobacteria bacterium]|nr:D-tagatose-bisphosphate aldolase, class II, non-catalytic subunit [Gammaproteobacteria bacterium]
MNALPTLLARHKSGEPVGVPSICSAHPLVLAAALASARTSGAPLLIEATANQVNQLGGYTGMTPQAFRRYVHELAAGAGVAPEQIWLGGDHLGPTVWRQERAAAAMDHAATMVEAYVAAGFRKIHLDCSMACADDPVALSDEAIAARAARLCAAAERAWGGAGGDAPVYVIGTEVPTPGGATHALATLEVTTAASVDRTLESHRSAFAARGLEPAWERVVALVVQPGVEFDNHHVVDYRADAARALSERIEREPRLVYEAHSTDYQTERALARLVRDHFAILKVGPALTFALREALWALDEAATTMGRRRTPSLKETVLAAMRADPRHWSTHYTDPRSETIDLQFSLSDRIRYYWTSPAVQGAVAALLGELERAPLPPALLSQYLPVQYAAIRAGEIDNLPRAMIAHAVQRVLGPYTRACGER